VLVLIHVTRDRTDGCFDHVVLDLDLVQVFRVRGVRLEARNPAC
jgi:hypothetical protein